MKVGDRVRWSWGEGFGEGVVKQIYKERVERTIKGSSIVRNGDDDDPALFIRQDDGDEVLKLQSEVDAC